MKLIYKNFEYILLLLIIFSSYSCEKEPTDYRYFLNGQEKIYPGVASNIQVNPGNSRLLFTWIPSSDPSVTKYILYWNNGTDSTIGDILSLPSSDTLKTYINNLDEGIYNFVVYFFNAKGDKSIPTNIENVRVYGEKYRGSLLNRAVSEINYANNNLTITWNMPDTINVTTEVKYTTLLNEVKTLYFSPDSTTLQLSDWKLPTKIYYRSSYKPQSNAIDTFTVESYDSLSVSNLPVDKSSWSAATLQNDAVVNAFGTALNNIWDGQPGSYPNIYHTDGAAIPHTFTINLGKTYSQLTKFEEWGRADCACSNPDDFEVWGIADTTGAATDLPASDAGWKDESITKGWTLITEVKRNDVGIAGVQVDIISNPPPVRFIRFRILHNVSNSTFSHMSEISFWYNP